MRRIMQSKRLWKLKRADYIERRFVSCCSSLAETGFLVALDARSGGALGTVTGHAVS